MHPPSSDWQPLIGQAHLFSPPFVVYHIILALRFSGSDPQKLSIWLHATSRLVLDIYHPPCPSRQTKLFFSTALPASLKVTSKQTIVDLQKYLSVKCTAKNKSSLPTNYQSGGKWAQANRDGPSDFEAGKAVVTWAFRLTGICLNGCSVPCLRFCLCNWQNRSNKNSCSLVIVTNPDPL